MALPSNILGNCTVCVELSTNGTTWTDFSDYISVLEPPGMTRDTGEAGVFGEDTKATAVGKRNPVDVTVRGIYTDGTATTDPYFLCWSQWTTACGGALAVRWSPAGCSTGAGETTFATATATGHYSELVGLTPPGGDASSGDPLMWEAVVRAPELFRATRA